MQISQRCAAAALSAAIVAASPTAVATDSAPAAPAPLAASTTGLAFATSSAAPAIRVNPLVQPGRRYYMGPLACTFAYLMKGSDGREYVANAGHCALIDRGGLGTKVWPGETGERVMDETRKPVGRFAYASWRNGSDNGFRDIAFIRLDKGVTGNPQMCGFGGPTGTLTAARAGLTELVHNGRGVVVSDVAPSRTAVAAALPQTHRLRVVGVYSFGDSGGPTNTADGLAVGLNSSLGSDPDFNNATAIPGAVVLQRFDLAVQDAEKALGIRLALRTAPLLSRPLPNQRC